MKLINNIVIDFLWSGRLKILLVVTFLLVGCASLHTGKSSPPPLVHSGPEVQIEDVDVLAVSPDMEKFLNRYVLPYKNSQTRLELLTAAVTRSGVLGFRYDESRTLTAIEAFEQRTGNCIGFANMLVALARRAGLNAHYQEVFRRPEWSNHEDDTVILVKHINVIIETHRDTWVVDVSAIKIHPTARRRIIEDSYAKALYLNNIAVESLLENDLPTAYAYMHSAIKADYRATDPWVNMGVIYGRNGQLDDAVFAFNNALQVDSNEYSALSNLYEVYVEQGDLASAAALEPRVERYRRNNPYYLLKLSDEALEMDQYEESLSLLQRAIKKKDDDHTLHFALAKTQYLSGELVEAQSSLVRAKELAPEDMMAYYDRPLGELVNDQ